MAMLTSQVAQVNSSHPYLENDPPSSLVSHGLRISVTVDEKMGENAGMVLTHLNERASFTKSSWRFFTPC